MGILYGFSDEKLKNITITQKRVQLNKEYIKFVDSMSGLLVIVNIILALSETEEYYGNNNKSTTSTNV